MRVRKTQTPMFIFYENVAFGNDTYLGSASATLFKNGAEKIFHITFMQEYFGL